MGACQFQCVVAEGLSARDDHRDGAGSKKDFQFPVAVFGSQLLQVQVFHLADDLDAVGIIVVIESREGEARAVDVFCPDPDLGGGAGKIDLGK